MFALNTKMHSTSNCKKTMGVIVTDGYENVSCKFSIPLAKQMIERQKAKFGWEFLFLEAILMQFQMRHEIEHNDYRELEGKYRET